MYSTTELVKITNPRNGEKVEFAMDVRLKNNLDSAAKGVLEKKDKDLFIIVDGAEGSGKSTLALQIGKYVDPTLG
jgi:pantothenate kinase-related protein Tda10